MALAAEDSPTSSAMESSITEVEASPRLEVSSAPPAGEVRRWRGLEGEGVVRYRDVEAVMPKTLARLVRKKKKREKKDRSTDRQTHNERK